MLNRLRRLVLSPVVDASRSTPVSRNIPSSVKLTKVEQRATVLAGKTITYMLKRSSKRRSIALRIDGRGLTVSTPLRVSERWLNEVLQGRADWVIEKLEIWQNRQLPVQQWADGEMIPYLGELLTLRVGRFIAPLKLEDDELRISVSDPSHIALIEKAVVKWYRQQAMRLFSERVAHYSLLLQVSPSALKLTTAKTRWGSCTASGMIRLNLQLIKLPLYLIDYVVVHELAHLHEMNHSAAFWKIVQGACPDYARLRSELKACSL
jgi:predicted metal-dependent hydrolase